MISTTWAQCGTCTRTVTTNASVTLNTGETLCIPAGTTYTGYITILGPGTTICNKGTVSGNYNISSNNHPVTIVNSGTWTSRVVVSNATITNTGNWSGAQLSVSGTAAVSNSGTWTATIENASGATATNLSSGIWNAAKISSTGTVTVDNSGTWSANLENANNYSITNSGSWANRMNFPGSGTHRFENTSSGTATLNDTNFNGGAVTIQNGGEFSILVNKTVPNATITNEGSFNTNSGITLSSTTTVNNSGTWTASTMQTSATFTNRGTVRTTTSFTNSGTFTNLYLLNSEGSLTNSGIINGPVDGTRSYVQAQTTSSNSGFFGQSGLLDFCDKSSANLVYSGGFDTQGGSVTNTNVTYCSRTVAAPLPVTLTSFRATREGSTAQIRWTTATETHNAGFRVERSLDNNQWEQRAFLESKNPDYAGLTSYHWTDVAAGTKAAYYRLVQQDTDGKLTFTPAVYVPAAGAMTLTVYPNPARGQVQIATADTDAELLLFNGQGQLVRQLPAGTTALSLAGLPAGMYLVRAGNVTERLLVE